MHGIIFFFLGLTQIEEAVAELNLGVLDLTSDEFILDEVDIHIQQNLEDEVVKAALESVINLRSSSNVFIFISPFYEG